MTNNMFIKLGKYGKLIICSDIHGVLETFKKCLNLWDKNDESCHILFNGDIIHGRCNPQLDKTPHILDIIAKYINYPNFHVLLGNHELSQIDSSSFYYRNMKGFRHHFIQSIKAYKGKKDVHEYKLKYYDLMCEFKFALITDNGLWVSHTGPSGNGSGYNIRDFMWNTIEYNDYHAKDVDDFLDYHNLKFMVVGHTEVGGYKFFKRQLIFNTTHHNDTDADKYYLEVDLSKPVNKTNLNNGLKVLE